MSRPSDLEGDTQQVPLKRPHVCTWIYEWAINLCKLVMPIFVHDLCFDHLGGLLQTCSHGPMYRFHSAKLKREIPLLIDGWLFRGNRGWFGRCT